MTSAHARKIVPLAVLLALVTLIFADVLFLGVSPSSGDLTLYHYPMKSVVREAVRSGEFPYWNRFVEAGQPLAANPAYELFYPPQWLIFLPSYLAGFKLHILFHYYVAAIGMYALARRLRLSESSAVIAAVAYSLGGPLMSVAGLLPFLFSMSWLPWLLFFALRFHERGRGVDFALAAAALAMQVIIGEPVVLVSSVLLLLIGAAILRRPIAAISIVIAAATLGAIQLIPMIDHAGDSLRAMPIDFATVRTWSAGPGRPMQLLVPTPTHGAPFLANIYLGLAPAVLAAAGIAARLKWWRTTTIVLAAAYLIAIGDHTPLLRILYDLGIFSSIRYPEKLLLPAIFVIVVFGAFALDELLRGSVAVRRNAIIVAAIAAVLSCIALAPADVLRAAVLIAILIFIDKPWARQALLAFAVIDVLSVAARLPLRVPDAFYTEPPALLAQLPSPRERIYHEAGAERLRRQRRLSGDRLVDEWLLRNEMIAYVPEQFGRAWALGTDFDRTALLPTLSLRIAVDVAKQTNPAVWPYGFMSMAAAQYRVVERDPLAAAAEARGDLAALTPVRVVREPIEASRYRFVSRIAPCRDVHDCVAHMRLGESVALVPASVSEVPLAPGEVRRWTETANTADVDVAAGGLAFLSISVTPHKYWHATIDGHEARLIPANIAYQGLFVPAGEHRIHLQYRNPMIAVGAGVSAFAAIFLTIGAWARRREGA